ncbi:hypothetical protein GCM10023194_15490 [Planotetraspora phitsanulokensis]|uniref:Uncharacterized protein n=1 Tax=Planotetraspora phitsanulokensis TaxID=575192 RepID=A0A8J3XFD8_9ACTN|nr:hypothetical protein Pph01_38420 [Planotetraspora phitsanulokensis]
MVTFAGGSRTLAITDSVLRPALHLSGVAAERVAAAGAYGPQGRMRKPARPPNARAARSAAMLGDYIALGLRPCSGKENETHCQFAKSFNFMVSDLQERRPDSHGGVTMSSPAGPFAHMHRL